MGNAKDEIQARLLSNVSDEYDKTEGSFFYDALKPVAIEMESAYAAVDTAPDDFFVVTATGTNLENRVAEQGLTRKLATKATTEVTITGNPGAPINEGDKVASDTVEFVFKEAKVIGETGQEIVLVECETAGSVGNVPAGAIKYFPVTLPGLSAVTNILAVTNGYDAETDEELRARYLMKVRTPATSGNIYHYRNWALEVVGVGNCRVFPIWDGPGTVKVVLINSNGTGADPELVDEVADHIEENRPIGSLVTVESAVEKTLVITFTAVKDTLYTDIERQHNVENSIRSYLAEIAFVATEASYAQIGAAILGSAGIKDYSNLLVNSGTSNIPISDDATLCEVAVLGAVTIA